MYPQVQCWPSEGWEICLFIVSYIQITLVWVNGERVVREAVGACILHPGRDHTLSRDTLCWVSFSEDPFLPELVLSTIYTYISHLLAFILFCMLEMLFLLIHLLSFFFFFFNVVKYFCSLRSSGEKADCRVWSGKTQSKPGTFFFFNFLFVNNFQLTKSCKSESSARKTCILFIQIHILLMCVSSLA